MDEQGQAILEGLKRGDDQAVEALFHTFFQPLTATAFRIVQDAELAKDIVQEVMIKLWTNREKLSIQSTLKGYLRRSVVNAAIDASRRYHEKHKTPLEPQEHAASPLIADGGLEKEETARLVDRALSQLPERCRLIFVLSRHEQLTYQQIATRLDISVKTVENQMSKALRLLREMLQALMSLALLMPLAHFF